MGAAPRPLMIVLGRRTEPSGEVIRRAAFTAATERALPLWMVRREERVLSEMPRAVRREVSLLGVRTRAMAL